MSPHALAAATELLSACLGDSNMPTLKRVMEVDQMKLLLAKLLLVLALGHMPVRVFGPCIPSASSAAALAKVCRALLLRSLCQQAAHNKHRCAQEAKSKPKETSSNKGSGPVVQWYDARARVALRCVAHILGIPWSKASPLSATLTTAHKDGEHQGHCKLRMPWQPGLLRLSGLQ